jgi:hypothetical protein
MKWAALVVAVVGLAGSATGFGVKVDAHEEECFHDDLRVITPLLLDPYLPIFLKFLSRKTLSLTSPVFVCVFAMDAGWDKGWGVIPGGRRRVSGHRCDR